MNAEVQPKPFETIENLSAEDYHKSDAISWSKLKFYSENFPATYRDKYGLKRLEPSAPTKAFDIGHAVEALVTSTLCGTDMFEKTCIVADYADFKTKVAQQFRDEARAAGFVPLLVSEMIQVDRMAEAVYSNKTARALIEGSKPQVTFRANLPAATLQCRPDFLNLDGVALPDGEVTGPYEADLKTIDSLSPSSFIGFDKQAISLGYHKAQAFYRYVIRMVHAGVAGMPETEVDFIKRYFIVVDKAEYPSCTVYTIPDTIINDAHEWMKRQLFCLLENFHTKNWPKAPERAVLNAPEFLLKKGFSDVF